MHQLSHSKAAASAMAAAAMEAFERRCFAYKLASLESPSCLHLALEQIGTRWFDMNMQQHS